MKDWFITKMSNLFCIIPNIVRSTLFFLHLLRKFHTKVRTGQSGVVIYSCI